MTLNYSDGISESGFKQLLKNPKKGLIKNINEGKKEKEKRGKCIVRVPEKSNKKSSEVKKKLCRFKVTNVLSKPYTTKI